jgi:hypothetical protein
MTAFIRVSKREGADESDDRRQKQRFADVGGLAPIDATGAGFRGHELVGDADSDDGADESVRTGGGETEIPRAEIPDDGGDEQRENHGEAGFAADLQDELYGEKRDDAEGDEAAGGENA